VIGVFSRLYAEFGAELYDDDLKVRRQSNGTVRFHYADARYEPHVQRLLPYDMDAAAILAFHRRLGTARKVGDLLHALFFSPDFPAAVAALELPASWVDPSVLPTASGQARRTTGRPTGTGRPRGSRSGSSSSRQWHPHRIAKQFLSVAAGPLRDALRRYGEDRIAAAVVSLDLDLGYGAAGHVLAATERPSAGAGKNKHDQSVHWADLRELRVHHGELFVRAFEVVVGIFVRVLVMDFYLLCRLVRFSMAPVVAPRASRASKIPSKPPSDPATPVAPRTAVVYVGDTHAENYVMFFRDYLGLRPAVCKKHRFLHVAQGVSSRCVELSPPTRAEAASPSFCPSLMPSLSEVDPTGSFYKKVGSNPRSNVPA
jgi:hypothetical protein